MFRILPRTPLSSRRLSTVALFLLLLPAAVQALPATVPAPAAPAPAPATSGPLETAWAWLTGLFAPDDTLVTRQQTPADQLDGATYNLVPIFFEGSHLDPNGGS